MLVFSCLICAITYSCPLIYGQSMSVGTPILEDAYRRDQLTGLFDSSVSFTVKPFFPSIIGKNNEISIFKILPLTLSQQYNSDHPEGLNNGAMIPARGYQTMISGGLFAKYRWLSVQLRPEYVFAENKEYQGFPDQHSTSVWYVYNEQILKTIDIPERFGTTAYKKAFWGQSSIRLTFNPISIGLSNENLWWGPGMQNSLLMTNNAPGFKHLTLNTVRPLRTFIGSFEGQLVGGRLDASGYPGIDSARLVKNGISYLSKPKDWRYLNGFVLTYQPRWLPGLFLGAARSYICYYKDLGKKIGDYFPIIVPMLKKALGNDAEDAVRRDELASVFVRWVAPELEVYFEFGREDHNYDISDFLLEPEHSRAYIMGFRKMTPFLNRNDEYIDIHVETSRFSTNMKTWNRTFFKAMGWYSHLQVVDGYTHNGQFLGAGIGTSSNMQSVNISWVKKMKRLGLEFKRVTHDDNFWALVSGDPKTHWVDFGGGIVGEWDYKHFLLNTRVQLIGSNNYQFLYDPKPSELATWYQHGEVRYNVHAELGITYLF